MYVWRPLRPGLPKVPIQKREEKVKYYRLECVYYNDKYDRGNRFRVTSWLVTREPRTLYIYMCVCVCVCFLNCCVPPGSSPHIRQFYAVVLWMFCFIIHVLTFRCASGSNEVCLQLEILQTFPSEQRTEIVCQVLFVFTCTLTNYFNVVSYIKLHFRT